MAAPVDNESVVVLPSNRSLILADSRFRLADTETEQPYDFICELSGTGIYARELYYTRLFWNQALFSHNNSNCELRFQLANDGTTTYVVYATPFLMFTDYDGNPPGTSLLTPQLYSYAANMERGLNTDVRLLPTNQVLINGTGNISIGGNAVTMFFRYNPARGFYMYAQYTATTLPIPLRLLPCNYVSGAHFVHGFGVWDPASGGPGSGAVYIPRPGWRTVYISDCSPNLLPIRYVSIVSEELNKDRRLISFSNSANSKFLNELAIVSLNPVLTGVFHEDTMGNDATVISLREGYTPQRFRITILKEDGDRIIPSDPISSLLQSQAVPGVVRNSFLSSGSDPNRGDHFFMNYLLFGAAWYNTIFPSTPFAWNLPFNSTPITGMDGIIELRYYYGDLAFTSVANLPFRFSFSYNCATSFVDGELPIYLQTNTTWNPSLPPFLGFTGETFSIPRLNNDAVVNGPLNQTVFTWIPSVNPMPWVSTAYCSQIFRAQATAGAFVISTCLVMYCIDDDPTDPFGQYKPLCASIPHNTLQSANNPVNSIIKRNADPISFASAFQLLPNPYLPANYYEDKPTLRVSFAFRYYIGTPFPLAPPQSPPSWQVISGSEFNPYSFTLFSRPSDGGQTEYIPPVTSTSDYLFGNPLADALKEEVIHEIQAVLQYN